MLVPAMTFAWWLVSMSTPASHTREVADESQPTAEAATATEQRDTEDEATPAERTERTEPAAAGANDSDETGDTTGQRLTLKVVTAGIVRLARTFLDLPMGAERFANVDGRRYVFVLERHYHPPGFVGGPHGWHKGVTVYEVR